MGKGGGGGGAPPTQQTVTQTNLPEYAKPYFENIMQRAQAESYRPYTPYQEQRVAGFTPGQTAAQAETLGMQTPQQIADASTIAGQAAVQSAQAGQYAPGQFSTIMAQAPQLARYQMGPAQQVSAQQVGTPTMQAATTRFDPNLQRFQMQAPQDVTAQALTTPEMRAAQIAAPQQFGTQQAQQYMSPYMQQVLDVQKRQAIEDAQKAQLATNLASARSGTYGGARQLLATTEREKALGQQLGDIQARGLQGAYESAQQQFERDRAAGMQAGLANLNAAQQAAVQNQAAALQTQGLSAQQAMQAALANQQAQQTAAQQNLQAALGVQQLGADIGSRTALANLTNEQQAAVQNQAAQLQAQGMNADAALKAALANQQAGLTVGQQNLQSLLSTQQLGSQQSMQAQLANQQAMLDAQRAAEQSRQFGGTLGLQGLAQSLQGAQTLGQLGTQQQAADLARIQAQAAAGAEQRALQQQYMDQMYADFMRQRDYPMEQLGYYSNLLRGIPVSLGSTATTYAQPPSLLSQAGGLGLAGLGLYNLAK